MLPQLTASLPETVSVAILSDRTDTIRASVRDVQHELIFAVALVVMVTFVFLRNIAATIIPSVVVPLSLIGTFGVMYLAGFSVNNLTLMALTIATGFVVDDAIVMVENIARYLEQGATPMQAALEGARQIGFTLVSLTVSLIAVLIPLLFMADVVGRLFREFAITLAVSILISLVVSLTLTPMMCARLLKAEHDEAHGRLYHATGRFFDKTIELYGKALNVALRYETVTLLIAVGTMALTAWLYVVVPKGFFPVQDTGAIQVITEAPQSVSFAAMAERQRAAARAILEEPDVDGLSSFIGVDGANATLNSGRMLVTLTPRERRSRTATEIIAALRERVARVPGIALYMQPVQDLTIEDRVSRTQFQFTLEDPGCRPARDVGAAAAGAAAAGTRTRRRRQRPAGPRPAGLPRHRPRCGQPPRRARGGHRRRAVRRVRPAADLDHLHAGQPVPRGARGVAALPDRAGGARAGVSSRRPTASRCRSRASPPSRSATPGS